MTDRYQVNPTFNNIYWIYDYRTPMGKSLFYFTNKRDAETACEYLNSMENYIPQLHMENQQIKDTIQAAYEGERTTLGRNVLRQLMEQLP